MRWDQIITIVTLVLALPGACASVVQLVDKWAPGTMQKQERTTMQYTQEETLALLKASKRKGWTLRQVTALRTEGYLPPLHRQTQPGTNRPRYVWNEEDLTQVCDVYDYWELYHGDRATLTLALWLQGYRVLLEPLREMYCRLIGKYLERLTHGETDPEDALFEASHAALAIVRKFKYTPGLARQRSSTQPSFSGMEWDAIIEQVVGALAVPDPETAGQILGSFARMAGVAAGASELGDGLATPEQITAVLHDILTLSHLYEATKVAAREQWDQAREDYLMVCQLLREIMKTSDAPALPTWFRWNLLMQGACWFIIPLLSARYRGYGHWIDLGREKMHEVVTDPLLRAKVRETKREYKRRKVRNVTRDGPTVLAAE